MQGWGLGKEFALRVYWYLCTWNKYYLVEQPSWKRQLGDQLVVETRVCWGIHCEDITIVN